MFKYLFQSPAKLLYNHVLTKANFSSIFTRIHLSGCTLAK